MVQALTSVEQHWLAPRHRVPVTSGQQSFPLAQFCDVVEQAPQVNALQVWVGLAQSAGAQQLPALHAPLQQTSPAPQPCVESQGTHW